MMLKNEMVSIQSNFGVRLIFTQSLQSNGCLLIER